jgi:hypothetical protein
VDAFIRFLSYIGSNKGKNHLLMICVFFDSKKVAIGILVGIVESL